MRVLISTSIKRTVIARLNNHHGADIFEYGFVDDADLRRDLDMTDEDVKDLVRWAEKTFGIVGMKTNVKTIEQFVKVIGTILCGPAKKDKDAHNAIEVALCGPVKKEKGDPLAHISKVAQKVAYINRAQHLR